MWHPDFIMSVRTRDFMVTTLILPPWEKANEFYVGDPVVFEAKKIRSNVIAVRSRNAGADSNLTVLGGGGNVYNFYLRSETWNSTQVSDLTVYVDASRNGNDDDGLGSAPVMGTAASFDNSRGTGGAEGGQGQAIVNMPDYLRKIVFRPEDLRFDMKMFARNEADVDIAPERIFEDGIFTYFDFGDRSDSIARPVVHHLVDGVDTVVNTRTAGLHGNILIAEAVGDFTLRSGNRVVCVRRADRKQTSTPIEIGGSIPEAGGGLRSVNEKREDLGNGGGARQ
jgi:ComB9 competence protein